MQKKVSISVFGSLQVTGRDGAPVAVDGAKLQGLLAYLAMNLDLPPTRDRLTALLWGERFTSQARQSLRQAVSKLRRLLNTEDDEVIWADQDRAGLREGRVTTDLERFTRLVAARSPEQDIEACKLYNGSLLENLYLREQDFQHWLLSERQRVATIACPVFERAVRELVRRGDTEDALELARRLISFDTLREPSHRMLMRILAQSGQRAAAIQQYNLCADLLLRELDVEPAAETQKLLQEIRAAGFGQSAEPEDAGQPEQAAPAAPAPAVAPALSKSTIAVLPFLTLVPDARQDFLAGALAEDINAALSNFRWLEVMASPVTSNDRLTAQDMQRFAREHGLKYAVSGVIRSHGSFLRLTVQLIGLERGRFLWVSRYDRTVEALLDAGDALSQTIAASIETELESIEGREARGLDGGTLTAWDFYHRGLATQYEFSPDTNEQAQAHFRSAIALDPGFASARARLAYAMVLSAIYFGADHQGGLLDEALEHATRAARLGPQDSVCRFALGRVYLARGDYQKSVSELQAAIDLNPSMAQAHCGLGDVLTYSGRANDAMACFEEAVRLSPQDPYRWAFLNYGAMALLFEKKFEEAADWAGRAAQVPNSHFWASAVQASALGHMGRLDEAREAVGELVRARPEISCDFVRERLFYLREPSQVETYIEGLRKAGLD